MWFKNHILKYFALSSKNGHEFILFKKHDWIEELFISEHIQHILNFMKNAFN